MKIIRPLTMKSLFSVVLLLASFTTSASECDFMSPSFLVDGKEQWVNQTATEIFDQSNNKINLTQGKKGQNKSIHLNTLVKPYASQGTLMATNCSNQSLNLDIKTLTSKDAPESDYVLILSNKGFFKIVTAQGSQQILKKINQLKLITHSNNNQE